MEARRSEQFSYLAALRLREAKVLLRSREWAGAQYLCGYVVECALKALIARRTGGELPDRFMTHDLETLADEAAFYLEKSQTETIKRVPRWGPELRYICQAPSAQATVEFINKCEEAYRCLAKAMP